MSSSELDIVLNAYRDWFQSLLHAAALSARGQQEDSTRTDESLFASAAVDFNLSAEVTLIKTS